MRAGGSSSKGSGFERAICRELSLWVTSGKDDDIFWRTAGSGSMATTRRKKGKSAEQHLGDMAATKAAGRKMVKHFFVEMKFYEDIDFMSFVLKYKGKLAGFWSKAKAEAKASHRETLLIAKQNRMPTFVLLAPTVQTSEMREMLLRNCQFYQPSHGIYLLLLDEFLTLDPKVFSCC